MEKWLGYCLFHGHGCERDASEAVKSPLWWFDNGTLKGTSTGRDPFVVGMSCGRHVLTCATPTAQAPRSSSPSRRDDAALEHEYGF